MKRSFCQPYWRRSEKMRRMFFVIVRFNLYAVSNHFGSLEGGHYTAYCSSDVLKKWYKFDDQGVSVMDAGDIVTPAAYTLFFTAIKGQTILPPL